MARVEKTVANDGKNTINIHGITIKYLIKFTFDYLTHLLKWFSTAGWEFIGSTLRRIGT